MEKHVNGISDIIHYQRVGSYLTSGCGKSLSDSMRWSIDHNKITCKCCKKAINNGKEEG